MAGMVHAQPSTIPPSLQNSKKNLSQNSPKNFTKNEDSTPGGLQTMY